MTTPTFEQQLQLLYDKWVAFCEYSHNPEKTDAEVIEQEEITDEQFREVFKISHPDGLPPNRRRK
jgi:predicted RNA polymerase sigma factor